ncbi:MAG: hypothetical protein M5R42_09555 [Rhodocyclaceae bacterium]|nr:hypothetical protein [Rhodocyclaceae bacterium]
MIDGEAVAVSEEIVAERSFLPAAACFKRDAHQSPERPCWRRRRPPPCDAACADTVRTMLPDHDVYIADWVDASPRYHNGRGLWPFGGTTWPT